MTLSGRPRHGQRKISSKPPAPAGGLAARRLREFAYLDQVSVQSLLASIIGELPEEVTSLSARSNESEVVGSLGVATPLIAKAELSARYKGAASTSNQVLSRAVAQSLFKSFYELIHDQLAWSPDSNAMEPVDLPRGALIEMEVDLAADPVYRFNSTMGVLADLAEDYPALLNEPTTAMVMSEAGPIIKTLDRMLAGLIPLRAESHGLRVADIAGKKVAAPADYFTHLGVPSSPVHLVGVTEQENYWRDVRRVLFSGGKFTVLGRISRAGIQTSWVPVKLTEVMREIAPEFPSAIARAGKVGYGAPVNSRQEANRDALERALAHFARSVGGEPIAARIDDIETFARTLRDHADSLTEQRAALDTFSNWLTEKGLIASVPENRREIWQASRSASGLRASSAATSISDLKSPATDEPEEPENLIDVEVIAIYW